MNEDGNEHEPGGGRLGGNDQPNAPAPRYEPTTMKIPPIPAVDPGLAATVAKIPFVSGAASDDKASRPKFVRNSDGPQPSTPERKRLRYLTCKGSFTDTPDPRSHHRGSTAPNRHRPAGRLNRNRVPQAHSTLPL